MSGNPFQPTVHVDGPQKGQFGDGARQIRAHFLYREIELEAPIRARFVYDGWWFRQKITFNGQLVWFRVSWLKIHREATFNLPAEIDPERRLVKLEITFSPALWIRRFQILLDGETIYDEIH